MDKNLKKKIVNLEKKIKKKKNPYLESSKKVNKKGKKEMKKSEKKKEVDLHNKYYLALQYFEHSDFEKAINTIGDNKNRQKLEQQKCFELLTENILIFRSE